MWLKCLLRRAGPFDKRAESHRRVGGGRRRDGVQGAPAARAPGDAPRAAGSSLPRPAPARLFACSLITIPPRQPQKQRSPAPRRATAGAGPRATDIIAPEIRMLTEQGDPLDK